MLYDCLKKQETRQKKENFNIWKGCQCVSVVSLTFTSFFTLQLLLRHKPNGSTLSTCERELHFKSTSFDFVFNSMVNHKYILMIKTNRRNNSYLQIRKSSERWDGGVRAVFAQWKRGLVERPISGLKCLKTMTTSTSLTTDDMWCISCGGSKEALWKLSWPHFLLHWNHHKVTPGQRAPIGRKGTDQSFILTSWLTVAAANLFLTSNNRRYN